MLYNYTRGRFLENRRESDKVRKKPVSCSLYPIRVTRLTGGGLALNLHRWEICKDAFRKGRREGIRVYQFLRKPLTDAYGEDFYEALDAAAGHILSSHK